MEALVQKAHTVETWFKVTKISWTRIPQSLHIFWICSLLGGLGVERVFVCSYLPVGDIVKHLSDLGWILHWGGDGVWGTQGIHLHGLEALAQKVVILMKIKQNMTSLKWTTSDGTFYNNGHMNSGNFPVAFCSDLLTLLQNVVKHSVPYATVISGHDGISESRFVFESSRGTPSDGNFILFGYFILFLYVYWILHCAVAC